MMKVAVIYRLIGLKEKIISSLIPVSKSNPVPFSFRLAPEASGAPGTLPVKKIPDRSRNIGTGRVAGL